MVNGYIYKIENTVNGKFYIGSTVKPKLRKRDHFTRLRGNRHNNTKLQSAWNYYGENNFTLTVIEVLENVESNQLIEREQFYLDNHKPHYNLSPNASNSGRILSEETKRKISATKKKAGLVTEGFKGKVHTEKTKSAMRDKRKGEKNFMFGKTHTEEARRKISITHQNKVITEEQRLAVSKRLKGRKFSEEHKQKISEALTGRTHTEEQRRKNSNAKKGTIPWNKGKKHTEETKARMREAKKKSYLVEFDPGEVDGE